MSVVISCIFNHTCINILSSWFFFKCWHVTFDRRKHYLCISAPAMPLPNTPPQPGPAAYDLVNYEGPPKHYMSSSAFVSTTSRWTGNGLTGELPGPGRNIEILIQNPPYPLIPTPPTYLAYVLVNTCIHHIIFFTYIEMEHHKLFLKMHEYLADIFYLEYWVSLE